MKVRKKSIVVDAYLLRSSNLENNAPNWIKEAYETEIITHKNELGATIVTLEGLVFVPLGHYLIRGVEGEIYGCSPRIFEKTYDIVKNKDFTNAEVIE